MIRIVILLCFFSLSSKSFKFHPPSIIQWYPRQNKCQTSRSRNCFREARLFAHLVSFDLDDTIFPVAPVMNDANNALMRHLESIGCHTTQDDFQKTIKVIRAKLTKEGKVMTYTDIRMRAIMLELEKYFEPSLISEEQILRSYNVWESNRHIAAEKYLYPDTIPMLEQIKRNHPEVIIAAITNGKGNPLKMKSICNYFDFCVSGEDKDVFPLRKPHEGIYKVALRLFEEVYKMKGKKLGTDICWIHIGDDLANDVGGSAKCGARSIWVDLEECYGQSASKRVANSVQPIWSSATEEELKARQTMDQNAKLLMSKRVTNLSLIPTVIREISHSATTKVTLDMNNQ